MGISPGLFCAQPSDHKITLEPPGHYSHSQPVKVAKGLIARVEVQLKRAAQ